MLLLVFALGWISGCLSSATMMSAVAPDGHLTVLNPEQSSRLVAAIELRLQQLGQGVSIPANLEDLRNAYRLDSGSRYLLIAAFWVGDPLPSCKVFVVEDKGKRTTAVFIDFQGGWPLSAPFNDLVIEAIELAFSDVLPDHEVAVERSAGVDLR